MKNSIFLGSLVIAMALIPSFASATNTAYSVDIGMSKLYNAPGVATVLPTLSQSQGSAQIVAKQFVVDHWEVLVGCDSDSPANCLGNIVT